MDTISVSQAIAERIEQELARVRAARPALASRISRAENILVTHLSCRRQRTIRVRVSGGRARFLVSGSKGAMYIVNPSDWSCTCPDHHRRGAGCKHALACWALWRASARPASHVEGFGHDAIIPTIRPIVAGRERVMAAMGSRREHGGDRRSSRHGDGLKSTGEVAGVSERSCSSCGDLFAERELIEIGPEQAEWTLTAFEGDELCGACASRHGVL